MIARATIALLALVSLSAPVQSQVIAGFNDATGVNSNATPNSPYNVNNASLNGQGVGEPGWAGPWSIGGAPLVVNSGMYEGDGAAFFQNTSAGLRNLSTPLSGTMKVGLFFKISQSSVSGNGIDFYTIDTTFTSGANVGSQWQAAPNGHMLVFDGTENGGGTPFLDTGFTWSAGVWEQAEVQINMITRKWDFYYNGVKYNGPHQMGFRGNITQLNEVYYLNEVGAPNSSYLDNLYVTPVPEPTSLVLTIAAGAGWYVRKRRRTIRGCL